MAGKQSAGMDKAEKAITENRLTVAQAAKQFGVTVNSIYRRPWYKAWRSRKDVK